MSRTIRFDDKSIRNIKPADVDMYAIASSAKDKFINASIPKKEIKVKGYGDVFGTKYELTVVTSNITKLINRGAIRSNIPQSRIDLQVIDVIVNNPDAFVVRRQLLSTDDAHYVSIRQPNIAMYEQFLNNIFKDH